MMNACVGSVRFFLSILALAILIPICSATATTPPAKDREAILKFAGCYEVTFDFKETFALTPGYQFKKPYHEQAVEYVVVDQDTGDKISLQHILVFRGMVQKHWRQEWTFEPDWQLQYKGFQTWDKVNLKADESGGRWVQRVFNVDDSPRYECTAPWIHWGSQSYWECETGRPLPRREYTTRNDYQIVQARNRQQLRADGWILEEDNVKVALENGKQKSLVKEKGENQYFRVEDGRCQAGTDYWKTSQPTWHAIVAAWNEVYQTNTTVKLVTPANGQELWEILFDLAERSEKSRATPQQIQKEASRLITPYVTKP